MRLKPTLKKYGFTDSEVDSIAGSITDFYPPQAAAIEHGALDGKSLLLAVPTAAGKTLIAELCMVKSILRTGGRCLYIAPLKALASEKFKEFKNKYAPLGIKIGIATGDFDSPSRMLSHYQILIATAEKVDSLLRTRATWLINELSVVVFDEIHFLDDGARGPTLEILIARIKQMNPAIQILALSATVGNAREVAAWLNACCITSDWRPVPLKEGVYYNNQVTFNEHGVRLIYEEAPDDLSKLTLDTLRGKGQVLVFVNSRRSAQAAARVLSPHVARTLTSEERNELAKIAKTLAGSRSESTKVCRKLADAVHCGVAFHHAGLRPKQREIIEDAFKRTLVKAICSTPTLAAGVNLPARRAIIRDCKRYEAGFGAAYIPTLEYKQCAGRAGRPMYDEFGEAVLIAKTFSESSVLFERYINAGPEAITSKLGTESALRIHALASIAAGYVNDIRGMLDFISHTFLAHQKHSHNLLDLIGRIFDFLTAEGLVEKSGFRYIATAFGNCVSRLYIDPLSGITLRDGIKKAAAGASLSSTGLLHLICSCPDSELLSVGKKDYENLDAFASSHHEELIITPENATPENLYAYLATLKTAWMLSRWIDEEKEENICDEFSIGPGDIHRHTESTQWLLHAAGVIAQLFGYRKLTFVFDDLHERVHYGIREELLELVTLKNIGRVRARALYAKGFRRLVDFRCASGDTLANIPHIGKATAQDIIAQVAKLTQKAAVR